MTKQVFLILLWLPMSLLGQQPVAKMDSLKQELSMAKTDTSRLEMYQSLALGVRFSNTEESLAYSDQALGLAKKLGNKSEYAKILSLKGATLLEIGKIPESLAAQFESLQIIEKEKDTATTAIILNRIGNTYMELGVYSKANKYYFQSKELFASLNDVTEYNELSNIGNVYELMGVADSAMHYQQLVVDRISTEEFVRNGKITVPEAMFRMGNAYKLKGDTLQALNYYKKGIVESYYDNDSRNLAMNNLLLARLYTDLKQQDSGLKYARAAIKAGNSVLFKKGIYDSALLLSELYRNKSKYDSAYAYLSMANIQKDSLTGVSRFRDLQRIILSEQEQQRAREALVIEERNTMKQYTLLAGLGIFLIIAFSLYYNNQQKQKANTVLEKTLSNLQSTQSQLIQSEKMASLGELTAGIAHEIQNPLNFVNNFSEVSNELIDEMNAEFDKGDLEEVKFIMADIKSNLEKINHHGKRADAIVKGMLQHSRNNSAEKEPTDINKLADEYFRLAYHGLRAKDKTFNANLETDFDESIGKIAVIPQDIGRVILNLITNAFYACNEKKKSGIDNYEPTVLISTKKLENSISISVKDNGNGIPKHVLDKIFQPFFTTKPTGEGTGLGLSMSYDIITQGHGGELLVETEDSMGTTFRIVLPITSIN